MYSVKLTADGITRYLSFETYTTAVSCISALEATRPGRYYPEDYFEAGTLSVTPKGEVLNDQAIATDFILSYSYKMVD